MKVTPGLVKSVHDVVERATYMAGSIYATAHRLGFENNGSHIGCHAVQAVNRASADEILAMFEDATRSMVEVRAVSVKRQNTTTSNSGQEK